MSWDDILKCLYRLSVHRKLKKPENTHFWDTAIMTQKHYLGIKIVVDSCNLKHLSCPNDAKPLIRPIIMYC